MVRITTVQKEYGENEGTGFVVVWDNDRKYLDVSLRLKKNFYIGREKPNEFGTGFIIRLGFLNIEYTNHYFFEV